MPFFSSDSVQAQAHTAITSNHTDAPTDEVLVLATAYEVDNAFEKHVEANGKPANQEQINTLFDGIAGEFIDRQGQIDPVKKEMVKKQAIQLFYPHANAGALWEDSLRTYLTVQSDYEEPMRLTNSEIFSGEWVIPPPDTIQPYSTDRIEAVGKPGASKLAARLSYEANVRGSEHPAWIFMDFSLPRWGGPNMLSVNSDLPPHVWARAESYNLAGNPLVGSILIRRLYS